MSNRPATEPPPIPGTRRNPGTERPAPDLANTTMPLSPEDILSQVDVDLDVERRATRPVQAPRREPSHNRGDGK